MSQQQVVQQTLDEVLLFVLEVKLFHGNRKVNPTDLAAALGVEVTQDDVFTLGVKRVFDKEFVNKLNRVKSAMERACLNAGTPFLGGYAVPDKKADSVSQELESLVLKGNSVKSDILANFTKICDAYASQHPQWESVIKGNGFSETYVRDRIQFGWRAIRVSAGRSEGLIADGLSEEVSGLLGSLLSGIAKAAERCIHESLHQKTVSGGNTVVQKRTEVTRKAFRPLVAAREKLLGFYFLDPRLKPLCEMIDHVLATMPDDGPIDGVNLTNLFGLASILTNSKLALEIGEQASTQDANTVFEQFFTSANQTMSLPSGLVPQLGQQIQVVQQLPIGLGASVTPQQVVQPVTTHTAVQMPVTQAMPALPAIGAVNFSNLFG